MTCSDPWKFHDTSGFLCQSLSHGRLYSTAVTSSPQLLFVHGGYHGAWCWFPMMRAFAQDGWATAAIDLRGHGGLEQTTDFVKVGIHQAAADVREALGILAGPVVLVGHSLGALVAMVAAQRQPLAGLVLMAPSPPGQLACLVPLPAYPEDSPVNPPQGRVAHEKFLSGYVGNVTPVLDRLCAESPRLMNDRYLLRTHVDASAIGCQVLCLSAGRDSKLLHPAGQDEAVARYFGADYVFMPDSAHDMMLDDSREAVRICVTNWLHKVHSSLTQVG